MVFFQLHVKINTFAFSDETLGEGGAITPGVGFGDINGKLPHNLKYMKFETKYMNILILFFKIMEIYFR